MPDVVDSLDEHIAVAGSIDRAALLPGMYLGWCVRLSLVTKAFKAAHQTAALRLNYGEGSGVELLVGCGGSLRYDWLSNEGQAFTRHYYPQYTTDWEQVFGVDRYAVEDNWSNYEQLAPVLTRALYAYTDQSKSPKGLSRWKFWQWH